jgi:hypothetical protein
MVYHDEHCFDYHTESNDLVEGQVLCSLSRLITSLCMYRAVGTASDPM